MNRQSTLSELRRDLFAAVALFGVTLIGAWIRFCANAETRNGARDRLLGHARLGVP